MLNFNNAPEQKETGDFSVIPNNSFVRLRLLVQVPKEGKESGLDMAHLSKSDKGNSYITFTGEVVDGKFKGNEIRYQMYVVDGSEKATNISTAFLRGCLESSRGIDPNDTGPKAVSARQVNGWGDFDGLEIVAKIGIDPPKNGKLYNNIKKAVTPDMLEYKMVKSGQDIISDEPIPDVAAAPAKSADEPPPWGVSTQPPAQQETNAAVPAWAR